jgi:uncharacterized protein YndB with AHSA1/START domain
MEITRHVTLPADPAEAWGLLTRPEELDGWLGADVQLDPTPGAAGTVTDHDGTRRRLVVEEVEPGRRIAWRWWTDQEGDSGGSRVEITVAPAGGGTLVTVVERPVPSTGGPSLLARAQVAGLAAAEAWSHRFLHLEALLLTVPARA